MARAPRRTRAKGIGKKTTRQPKATTRSAPQPDATPRPVGLPDEAIERALASGEQPGLLEDYFGPAQYAELRRLAQESAVRAVRGGERVLILPGIMGSKLGYLGAIFNDVLWADPIDIVAGNLKALRLPGSNPKPGPLGVFLFAYLKLKYRLRIAGYDAEFQPYDWRLSLVELGKKLAGRIDDEGRPVHLVAHSMGGLVARAALAHSPRRLQRIVMLGTPNHGSFAPIEAFRGTHSVVRKVAFMDLRHSTEELARDVFGTFPGLCEMVPSPELYPADYFDLSAWPQNGVRPEQRMLTAAKKVQAKLPADYGDLTIIAGVDRETVVGASIVDGEFVYERSLEGDGTVPLQCVRLASASKVYFINEGHGSLANNELVARAVDSILATGETTLLPDRYEPRRAAPLRKVRESDIDMPPYEGARGRPLSLREQRFLVEEFAAPDNTPVAALDMAGGEGGDLPSAELEQSFAESIVVGRRRQHRLDITLAFGSITEADAEAYVLGLFQNVKPGGAAGAVDQLLDGAIGQMMARRMFNANVGEISILPTGRHPVRADVLAFAGLGAFDNFREEVLEVVGENLVRTFLATRIDDFATVPIGGASGVLTLAALRHLLTGFFRGLQDADRDHRFRSITICETDQGRFAALRREMYRLSSTALFDDIEVTLHERELPMPPQPRPARTAAPAAPQSVYLIVRQETDAQADPIGFTASVLTAGSKAAVFKGRQEVGRAELNAHLERIHDNGAFNFSAMPEFGSRLAELVLPDSVRSILERYQQHPLVIVHDAGASRIPWETIRIGEFFPSLSGGLSHRYEADDLAIAKWLEQRQHGTVLDVLLVIDPTRDLPGAREEGERIRAILDTLGPAVRIRELAGDQARKHEVLQCFASGEFDVVHYAGHAFFDPLNPSRSGILCAGNEVLSGADLAGVGSLPSLVFFNACEAARVRKRGSDVITERVRRNVGFAEAFLRGGVANYVGTHWPVGDAPAFSFARTFYEALIAGRSLGAALMAGRQAVHELQSVDWADYILYGDPQFVLKQEQD
jgi:pimeloyl-ACP methyl ester carboxylesterase